MEKNQMTEIQEILGKAVLIPRRLIRSDSLTNNDKAVFGALSYLATKAENDAPDMPPSHCQVTESDIAELLGMQVRNVSTALTKLQAYQYIKWSAIPVGKGLSSWGYNVELFWD
jgi:DNA-binding MarR family transcriptional regulator